MVIAKNEEAHSFLSELLSNRKVNQEYLAVVWGILSSNQGTIKTNIAPKRSNKEMMCVAKKLAITHYSVQKVVGQVSLVKCVLETGRTHQVRMSHMEHSIFGDQIYGKNSSKSPKYTKSSDFIRNFNRQALHAYKLGLYHTKSKEYMNFCSDLLQDMRTLIDGFEEITSYRNKKNYLTTFAVTLIIVLKLFV